MVNDPIMEQIQEMKEIENEKQRRQKELDLLEKIYPDDAQINIVDIYIDNLQLAADISSKREKIGINISEGLNLKSYLEKE
jgi:hypothetical protein